MNTLTPIINRIVNIISLFLTFCLLFPLIVSAEYTNTFIALKVYLICFTTILYPIIAYLLYKYFKRIILQEINKEYRVSKIYQLEITEDNE
jgi:hypothetical protein